MSEEDYATKSVIECVEHFMKQNDNTKRKILKGLFQMINRLTNESIIVKALNDKEKEKWFNNEYCKLSLQLQQRIDKAIEYIKNCPEYLWANVNTKTLLEILGDKENE